MEASSSKGSLNGTFHQKQNNEFFYSAVSKGQFHTKKQFNNLQIEKLWGWAGLVIATSSVLTSEKKKNNKFTSFKFDAKLKELNTQLTSAIVQSGPSLHYRTGVLQAFSFATGGFYMVPFLPWFLSSHQQDFLWTASSFDKHTQKMLASSNLLPKK